VLIVDDEPNGRLALGEILSESGYEVATVGSAAEGLRLMETFHPHVLLTDVRMPGMRGDELARVAQRSADPPKVVFMSAYPRLPRSEAPWLVKPIDLDELSQTIAAAAAVG
jgi:two-component system C4-dicarboxylate transport response regulator DctD